MANYQQHNSGCSQPEQIMDFSTDMINGSQDLEEDHVPQAVHLQGLPGD